MHLLERLFREPTRPKTTTTQPRRSHVGERGRLRALPAPLLALRRRALVAGPSSRRLSPLSVLFGPVPLSPEQRVWR